MSGARAASIITIRIDAGVPPVLDGRNNLMIGGQKIK